MNKLEIALRYQKTYKNWLSVLYDTHKLQKKIKVKLRSGEDDSVSYKIAFLVACSNLLIPAIDLLNLAKSDKFLFGGQVITMHGMEDNGEIPQIFFLESYKFLDPQGEIVFDVGANIADSSIYFAIKGARKVIALEPSPYAYDYAHENVISSHLEEKIVLLNSGYGIDSEISVDSNRVTNLGSQIISGPGKTIKIYSLRSLLGIYKVDSAILKMDCEGCEYNIIKEERNVLRKFKRIQIEYHYGPEELVDKLEDCGFDVKFTRPKKIYNQELNITMVVGFIFAKLL